jgi:hypothetical protein
MNEATRTCNHQSKLRNSEAGIGTFAVPPSESDGILPPTFVEDRKLGQPFQLLVNSQLLTPKGVSNRFVTTVLS